MKAINGKWKISLFFTLCLSILLLQGIQYGQDNSKDKDNTYKKVARDLTSRLSKRVNLTKDQSGKVQDILVDYQKDISDKWNDRSTADNSGNKKDLSNDFRDADKKANDKIEKALSGNELSSYISSKKEWWAKIKDRVYSKDFMDLVNYREEDDDATVDNSKKSKDNRATTAKDNKDKSDNNDLSRRFEPYAKMMATELMQKLNLSLQQAADIQDALVDYQKSVADIREKSMGNTRDENVRVADNTGRRSDNRSDNVVGSNRRNENMSEFRDIDNSANDKIVNVLEDTQKSKYERVKNQWWKEVKDRVYTEVRRENRNISGKASSK